jgi:hypothetical protein
MSRTRRASAAMVLLLMLTVLCSKATLALARGYVIDQANQTIPIPTPYWAIPTDVSAGQEFVPAMDSIDHAEFLTKRMGSGTTPTELVVELYSESVTGVLLGTTGTVSVDSDYAQLTLFEFPSGVALVPGNTYVLILRELHGVDWGMGYSGDEYPSGSMIRNAVPYEEADAWFREGVTPGTPVTKASWAGIKALYSH